MNDEYTPNPPGTDEHMGAVSGDWTPVRVPGSEQGTLEGRRPDGDPQDQASPLGEAAADEEDAYDNTTGG